MVPFRIWLVVWLPFFAFSHEYWESLIIPIDEVIFFRGFFQQPDMALSFNNIPMSELYGNLMFKVNYNHFKVNWVEPPTRSIFWWLKRGTSWIPWAARWKSPGACRADALAVDAEEPAGHHGGPWWTMGSSSKNGGRPKWRVHIWSIYVE